MIRGAFGWLSSFWQVTCGAPSNEKVNNTAVQWCEDMECFLVLFLCLPVVSFGHRLLWWRSGGNH